MTTFEEPCCRGGAESGMYVLPATLTDNTGEERSNVAQRVMALIKLFLKYPIMSYLAGTIMGGVTENCCNTTAISKWCQKKTDFYCYQHQLLLIYLAIFRVKAHGRHLTLFIASLQCVVLICSMLLYNAIQINCLKNVNKRRRSKSSASWRAEVSKYWYFFSCQSGKLNSSSACIPWTHPASLIYESEFLTNTKNKSIATIWLPLTSLHF